MEGQVMTLVGGKQITVYGNRYCGICGELMHEEATCRKVEANVCCSHCHNCREYIACTQQCGYEHLHKNSIAKKLATARPAFSRKPP